jgi:SAM-dependent methyltransferase
VLDIGCGPGRSVAVLEELLPQTRYVGVDISPTAITMARQRYPDKAFFHLDLYDLPWLFEPNSFQYFFAQGVLCYVARAKMQRALRAIHAVIEPGGIGMIAMGIGKDTEIIREYDGTPLAKPLAVHYWEEDAFRQELTTAGFTILDPVSCHNCGVMTDIIQKKL